MKHTLRFSILFTLMMLGIGFLGMGQKDFNCGTISPTSTQDDLLQQSYIRWANTHGFNKKARLQTLSIPVKFHNILLTNGVGTQILSSYISRVLTELNFWYANAGISFYQLGTLDIVYDNAFYYFDISSDSKIITNFENITTRYGNTNAINIFFVETFSNANTTGLSSFPYGMQENSIYSSRNSNALIISKMPPEVYQATKTIPHEMGHYFGLYHTFESKFGNELVNGTNSSIAGDKITDTPADPNMVGCMNRSSCVFSSSCTARDANNERYSPQLDNIMSYYDGCGGRITSGQYNRVMWGKFIRETSNPALSQRYYLDGINKTVLDYSGDNVLCAGKTITLSFGAYGDPSYYQGIFSIQLKPISGSNNYYNISSGINTTSGTGTITGTIPVNTPAGYYKLRIYKSTSLAIMDVEELMVYINGTTNGILTGSSISSTLYLTASSTYYNATSTCGGNSISLSSNLAGYDSYRWLKDGQYLTATSTSSNLEASTTGIYTLKMIKCGNVYTSSNSIALTFYNLSTPSLTASANGELSATVLNVCSGTPVLLSATCATNTYPVWGNGLSSNTTSTSASVYANATTTASYTARCSNYFCISANSPPVRIVKEPSIQSVKTGDWQDATTWSCNCIPINCQDVSIEQGHTVNVPINDAKAKNITVKGILNFQNNAPPGNSRVSIGGI